MTFSSDEIEAGVSQIVQGASTFSRDGLGGRNVKNRFEETRELVNSVFLYEPDTVFYLIQKATIRARKLLNTVLSLMDDLEDDIDGMAVPARPVEDTASLADAGTALSAISGALGRRGSISSSEWQRYDKATNRALDTFKDAAKRTYTPFSGTTAVTDVVKSSAESAVSLRSNFNSLQTAYENFLTAVDRVVNGFTTYNHKRIATAVASRQVSRIQSEMSNLEQSFEASSPDDRAKTVRLDTLTVLTNRASVNALANLRYPGDPKLQQASGAPLRYRGSAYGTGSPPSITGTISAPWPILDSHELKIDFGGTDVTVPLVLSGPTAVPGIRAASLTGYVAESSVTFGINVDLATPWPLVSKEVTSGGSYTVSGTNLYLIINGTFFSIALTTGTATSVASTIQSAVGSLATVTGQSGGGQDWVQIAYNTTGAPDTYQDRYMQIASGPNDATDLGPWEVMVSGSRETGLLSRGWDGNDKLWLWPNDLKNDPEPAVEVDLPTGDWPDYVVTTNQVRDAINGETTEVVASNDNGKVKITSSDVGEGSIVKVITSALSGTRKTPSIRGAETLGFSKDQESREADYSSRALVLGLGLDASFAAKAVASSSKEVLTSGSAFGLSDNEIVILSEDAITADAGELKLVVEAGENAGVYGVSSYVSNLDRWEFTLDRNLREPSAEGLRANVYRELLTITAINSGTGSYIDVDETHGTSAHSILGLPTGVTRGTVTQIWIEYNDPAQGWVSADLRGLGIKEGDVIYLEDNSVVATVSGIDSLSLGILDVTAVDPTLSLTYFRIESVYSGEHSVFQSSLSDWREGLSASEETLSGLEKSINTLIKLGNPNRGRVQVAADELAAIRDVLEGSSGASTILESYSVPALAPVDRALDVMSQQGHDRARDLLTSARFTEYVRTTYKTASTAGAMMDAASKVAANDFVEPTKTRPEFTSEIDKVVFSSFDEVDPAYDFRDTRADSAPAYLDYFATDIPGR